jgi:hypothetical protein
MANHQTTDSSVFAIIAAFTSGLDVVKKLKKKRRVKKKDRATGENVHGDEDEVRLSRSLQRGSIDIRNKYEMSNVMYGDRFRAGDCKFQIPRFYMLIMNSKCTRYPRFRIGQAEQWPRSLHQHVSQRQEQIEARSQKIDDTV